MSKDLLAFESSGDVLTDLRALQAEHQQLEAKLESFKSRPLLSVAEQTERTKLKKQKLLLKDRMAALELELG